MQIVIDIPSWLYNAIMECKESHYSKSLGDVVRDGKPIPPGHGKIVDAKRVLENGDNWEVETALMQTEPIIEADKEYKVKVITRGNCRVCGKELTEGLFFCKECKAKIKSGEK